MTPKPTIRTAAPRRRLATAVAIAAALTTCPPALAGHEILGCATRAKDRVTPTDALDCQAAAGGIFATSLAQLYAEGWRLIDAEYFDADDPVFYLERPTAAEPPPSPPSPPSPP